MTKIQERLDKLHDRLALLGIKCSRGISFARLTTIRCGGEIGLLVQPTSTEQLILVMDTILDANMPYIILGKGSKVLARDEGWQGAVITTRHINECDIVGDCVMCSSGVNTVLLATELARRGLTGGEYLYCLPATIGGAVYMNAGCYGMETRDIVSQVVCYDTVSRCIITLDNEQCCFAKRRSAFFDNKLVILQVCMCLQLSSSQDIINTMNNMLANKRASQPLTSATCGSVFYTEGDIPASMLIDKAGLKGVMVGNAMVSTQHAGFFVNCGGATTRDIMSLMQLVEYDIDKKYNIVLQREVIVL